MNKKYMFGFLALFTVALVGAGVYYVNSLTITVDIGEPFDVIEYAILGSGSSYTELAHGMCSAVTVDWMSGEALEAALSSTENQYLDAGESRKICVRIVNSADADIPYVVNFGVTGDGTSGNTELCRAAFSDILEGVPWTGTVPMNDYKIDGKVITVDAGTETTNDCSIKIEVGRGTVA